MEKIKEQAMKESDLNNKGEEPRVEETTIGRQIKREAKKGECRR